MGLVGKSNEMFIKASCDFVAGAVIDGEKQLVGVECKARVTSGTHQRERAHTEFLSHFNNMSLMNPGTPSTTSSSTITGSTGTGTTRGTELYSEKQPLQTTSMSTLTLLTRLCSCYMKHTYTTLSTFCYW